MSMRSGFDIGWRVSKANFFDRPVVKRLAGAAGKVLSRFGAFVRRSARSSIKPAKQKSFGEMTSDERAAYEIRLEFWRRNKWRSAKPVKKPRRPSASSKPGEPPRAQSNPSFLKKIEFSFDRNEKSVVIGPVVGNSRGRVPEALEYGGPVILGKRRKRIAPRPFMTPAFDANFDQLSRWRNAVT